MLGLNRACFPFAALLGLALASGPAMGQADFSGEWLPIRTADALSNPYPGQFAGIPVNAEAIRRAEIWAASSQSAGDWQCRPHSAANVGAAAAAVSILKDVDPATGALVSFRAEWSSGARMPIYMDGRAHPPPYAAHTWGGFSTGRFEGGRLRVTTTHLKADDYRANGVPQSDGTTLRSYFIRRRFENEDYLTWVVIAHDPVYLTEPLVRSTNYRLAVDGRRGADGCAPAAGELDSRTPLPHYSADASGPLYNFVDAYALPHKLYSDGAATMYPEYRRRIRQARQRAAPQAPGRKDGQ